jgi:hypothetical protein
MSLYNLNNAHIISHIKRDWITVIVGRRQAQRRKTLGKSRNPAAYAARLAFGP